MLAVHVFDSRHWLMQGLYKILDQQTLKSWNDMYDLTDSYTDGWLLSGMLLFLFFC